MSYFLQIKPHQQSRQKMQNTIVGNVFALSRGQQQVCRAHSDIISIQVSKRSLCNSQNYPNRYIVHLHIKIPQNQLISSMLYNKEIAINWRRNNFPLARLKPRALCLGKNMNSIPWRDGNVHPPALLDPLQGCVLCVYTGNPWWSFYWFLGPKTLWIYL